MVWQGLAPSSSSSSSPRPMLQLEAAAAPSGRATAVMSPEIRYRHVRSLVLGNPNSRSAAAWSEWPRDGGAVAQHMHRFWTEPPGSAALSPPRVVPSCSSLNTTPQKLQLGCPAAAGPLLALSSSSSSNSASVENLEPGSAHSRGDHQCSEQAAAAQQGATLLSRGGNESWPTPHTAVQLIMQERPVMCACRGRSRLGQPGTQH